MKMKTEEEIKQEVTKKYNEEKLMDKNVLILEDEQYKEEYINEMIDDKQYKENEKRKEQIRKYVDNNFSEIMKKKELAKQKQIYNDIRREQDESIIRKEKEERESREQVKQEFENYQIRVSVEHTQRVFAVIFVCIILSGFVIWLVVSAINSFNESKQREDALTEKIIVEKEKMEFELIEKKRRSFIDEQSRIKAENDEMIEIMDKKKQEETARLLVIEKEHAQIIEQNKINIELSIKETEEYNKRRDERNAKIKYDKEAQIKAEETFKFEKSEKLRLELLEKERIKVERENRKIEEDALYKKIMSPKKTYGDCIKFINEFNYSKYINEVSNIEKILRIEDKLYNDAISGTSEDCDVYITKYAYTYRNEEVRKIRSLKVEEEMFQIAMEGDSSDCFRYMKKYTYVKRYDVVYSLRNKKLLEEKQYIKDQEYNAYIKAKEGSAKDCLEYIKKYPHGKHINEVKKLKMQKEGYSTQDKKKSDNKISSKKVVSAGFQALGRNSRKR